MNDRIEAAVAPLASLKITVALLGMATFLVFAGTVAQVDKSIWAVVDEYFRCAFARIELKIFFPRAWDVPGAIWFPGGWLIAGLMLVNLLSAHIGRFRIRASGARLVLGTLSLLAGTVLVGMVLAGTFDHEVAATEDAAFWRVLLRLAKGGGVALVLLIGCMLLFARRAGIVLLHGGIILLIVSEFLTGAFAVEGRMRINAGESVNYVEHVRSAGFAFVDRSNPEHDRVTVIPRRLLHTGAQIQHDDLPVDIEVVRFMANSSAVDAMNAPSGVVNPATRGSGRFAIAVEAPPVSGTDPDQTLDIASAYIRLTDKGSGADLGTYLVTPWLSGTTLERQGVEVNGRAYELSLRFARSYKPYRVEFLEFRHDTYVGTEKARNFSSLVRLVDEQNSVDRTVKIWMNNPLRYAGETFYQSSFEPGKDLTILQVVRNRGWMIPYLSCMVVGAGMTLHMGGLLMGFLRKKRGVR